MNVLLVQPRFPVAAKSLNHKSFLPVGLLKLGAWEKSRNAEVKFVVGKVEAPFAPDRIYITSLFTYWSSYVHETVRHYRGLYPGAEISVGGIYASLAPKHCAQSGAKVHAGLHEQADLFMPDYSLVDTDFQIVHASRGCIRRCRFCGVYRIEPKRTWKESIANEIVKRHLVFYDNNLLANPSIESLLAELADYRLDGRVITAECQSGFDGRLLTRERAQLLKAARFRYPRIAWDGPYEDAESIHEQLQMLVGAGFAAKDVSVFMIYNHELSPETLAAKVSLCLDWGVQVADCRYRPLDLFEDGYDPRARSQADYEYFVHAGWTDSDVRSLRRLVRQNNICVRYGIPPQHYDQRLEGLDRDDRRQLMDGLGMRAARLTRDQLEALNAAYLSKAPPPERREDRRATLAFSS